MRTEVIATQIKQSLLRLAARKGKMLLLPIYQELTITGSRRNSFSRDLVNRTEEVDIDNLELVSVQLGENAGLCVRLIFASRMFAICGEGADQIAEWANECGGEDPRTEIRPFPSVRFESVLNKVMVRDGEFQIA